MIVITSSISPTFSYESSGVFAVIDGLFIFNHYPPFTYSSHALPSESNRKSNPYNSKECGLCVTNFCTAFIDFIIALCTSENASLVFSTPNLHILYLILRKHEIFKII